jgi:hypothetical protein
MADCPKVKGSSLQFLSLGSFGASAFGFNLAIAWLSIGDERIQQLTCRGSDFFHGAIERSLVRLRRLVAARKEGRLRLNLLTEPGLWIAGSDKATALTSHGPCISRSVSALPAGTSAGRS